jgi:hypothetical protein
MTHNVTKLPQMKDNKSHVKHILLHMCQLRLNTFLTHDVPNTPQVKPTEDNCEVYFTQHVSTVTLCRCQIYSVGHYYYFCILHDVRFILKTSCKKYEYVRCYTAFDCLNEFYDQYLGIFL